MKPNNVQLIVKWTPCQERLFPSPLVVQTSKTLQQIWEHVQRGEGGEVYSESNHNWKERLSGIQDSVYLVNLSRPA